MSLRKIAHASASVLCLFLAAATARATNINASTGTALYSIMSDTTGESFGPGGIAPVVSTLGSNWATVNGALWIAPDSYQDTLFRSLGLWAGKTLYQTTFSLAGLDPTAAQLSLNLASEDGIKVFLNGKQIYANSSSNLFSSVTSFTTPASSAYFVSGLNTLSFEVTSSGAGATGFSAAAMITAFAQVTAPPTVNAPLSPSPFSPATPEPATAALVLSALAGLVWTGRRRLSAPGRIG